MGEEISIKPRDRDNIDIALQFEIMNREEFNERMDCYGFTTKAEAARYFINIGMKSIVENDPRNTKNNRSSQDQKSSHSPETIRDFIPEGEDNAVDIRDELLDVIEDEILNICRRDPEINIDNWKVYK